MSMSAAPQLPPIEKHYKIRDLQERLSLSYECVRQLVMNEPGVVVLSSTTQSKGRSRNTYLIPESVIMRILRRNTNPGGSVAMPTRLLQRAVA